MAFQRGDVVWAQVPADTTNTRVQQGTRPAVVVREIARVALTVIIPGTSNLKVASYPFTLRVDPDQFNGLTVPTVLMAFQIRALDTARLGSAAIGTLKATDLKKLEELISQTLGF